MTSAEGFKANHPSNPDGTIVLKVARQRPLVTIGNLKVLNDPSYSRQCVRCREAVVVSATAEAMNTNAPDLVHINVHPKCRVPMVYVCDVCIPTPLPTFTPTKEDGPHTS